MSLRRRDGIWFIDLKVAGAPRYRQSTRTRDRAIALAKHAEVERALRLGLDLATGKLRPEATLGDVFDRALREHWRGQKGVATVRQHIAAVHATVPASTPVADVPRRVPALVEALRPDARPATANRTLQTLRKALALAVEWGYLDRVPKLPRFAEPAGRKRVYTAEEEAAILAFFDAQDQALARLTRILFATGWRLAEALKRDRIVLHPGAVQVWDTKTSAAGRTIPCTPALRALLVDWLDGEGFTKDQVEWRWRRMRGALGLGDEAVIHAIRHTVCTRLLRGGMSTLKVMLWMGHRDVETTRGYSHLDSSDLTEGAALVQPAMPSTVP